MMNEPVNIPQEAHTDPLAVPLNWLGFKASRQAAKLAQLNLYTVRDLLWYAPKYVLDLSHLSRIQDLTDDRIHTVRGHIVDVDTRSLSRGRSLVAAILRTEEGLLKGAWFNQPWMFRRLQSQQSVLWSGKPKFRDNRWEMNNPRLQWLEEEEQDVRGIVLPKYGLTEGLTLDRLRAIILEVLEWAVEQLADALPQRFREHYQLPDLQTAIFQLHRPDSVEQYEAAFRRLVFDEQLDFQLGLELRKRIRLTAEKAPPIEVTPKVDARIRRLFPFPLTNGQRQAIADLTADVAKTTPMHRLLQADVGAGKTVVALYGMLACVAAGYQAVLMAPTELLARQHWQTVQEALLHSRVKRTLLTSALTSAQRKQTLAEIASGQLQLIIGTQAVIQQDVVYRQVGLVVIDEQHKFGVEQRGRFSGAETSPHTLVMTATPIPRSLCMTQFGDLDLSLMTDLPPGRQTVVTSRVLTEAVEQKAWKFVREKIAQGRQAYVVCPHVDNDDPEQPAGAVQTFHDLQLQYPDLRIGLVHGQLERTQQQSTMDAFRDQELDILVATTVVEVGVDVPNATLMIVLDAHQFGLSQLHQLRGRIGRGKFQGYCFLFSQSDSEESQKRLQAMEETNSGFEIAEADFALRGPGNLLGTAQSGALPFRISSLPRDEKILDQARTAAQRMVQKGTIDAPEFAPLKQRVLERFGDQLDFTRTG